MEFDDAVCYSLVEQLGRREPCLPRSVHCTDRPPSLRAFESCGLALLWVYKFIYLLPFVVTWLRYVILSCSASVKSPFELHESGRYSLHVTLGPFPLCCSSAPLLSLLLGTASSASFVSRHVQGQHPPVRVVFEYFAPRSFWRPAGRYPISLCNIPLPGRPTPL